MGAWEAFLKCEKSITAADPMLSASRFRGDFYPAVIAL